MSDAIDEQAQAVSANTGEQAASQKDSQHPSERPNPRSPRLLITLITFAALTLRLWGLTWSLPNDDHLFSYHPDEGVNLVSGVLENLNPRPHFDLGFYNYGSVYFYLWQGAVAI